ncbi:MAG: IS200/IS605 family transposase [Anaerolineaceae bacterium]|nr:IS200/IS605 family transposase [Anaerolineaceae bacterium]
MPVAILVATPNTNFGELLRISLEENGPYQVRLVSSGKEAKDLASEGNYQIAIIDAAIKDEPFLPLCKKLRETQNGIRLVVIPPDNNVNHPLLGDLIPHGYISCPFYLPDLIDTISHLFNETESEDHMPVSFSPTLPPWLKDPISLQTYLEQELQATQAMAGLIGVYTPTPNPESFRIWAGKISPESAAELTTIVFRYWNRNENTDLMRFIRLSADKKDYLVYATRMKGDYILILAYDTKAPLSLIRPQTKNLAQVISTIPPKPLESTPNPNRLEWLPEESLVESQPVTQSFDDAQLFDRVQSGFSPYSIKPVEDEEDTDQNAEEEEQEIPNLTSLLGSFPSPDPDPFSPARSKSDPEPVAIQNNQPSEWHTWQESPDVLPDQPVVGEKVELVEGTQPTSVSPTDQKTGQEEDYFLAPEPAINSLEDTRPHVVASLTNIGQLEPVSPALSQLNYTCVLLPRLPQHYLTGELADRLAQWVQHLCLAYGWRLEGISIRPEFLQWTVQVAPSISPGHLVRIIRQRSSLNIFSQYTHLRDQNPSGDFWASGYLIVSGAQPPSAQLLREYISQTRKRQGVIK